MTTARSSADWELIERDYRAGIKSLRQIASDNGVTHPAIRKRAEKEGWVRDLSAKIRAAAQAQVTREQVTSEVTKANERDIVEANAALQAQLIREHRKDIGRARKLAELLADDLATVIGNREAIEEAIDEACTHEDDAGNRKRDNKRFAMMMKAVALPENIGSLESLSRTLKNLVAIERQAFGIEAKTDEEGADGVEVKATLKIVKAPDRV